MKITVETIVNAPIENVWRAWTTPEDIKQWNTGTFSSRMEAKDGSMGFDFAGIYTNIVEYQLIESAFLGDRVLLVEFLNGANGVTVRETFDAESTHSVEQQREGWQAILNNFARHVELSNKPTTSL